MVVLAVLGIWLIWTLLEQVIEADRWAWYLMVMVLGTGAEALIDIDHWWLGPGIGGAVVILGLLTDLLLVATDLIKMHVLRQHR